MKLKKDLTKALEEAEGKDRFYQISGRIIRLLAPQYYTRPFTYRKRGWGSIERVETLQDGTPTDLRQPKRKKRIRKGESEVKQADCWTFKLSGDGVGITKAEKPKTKEEKKNAVQKFMEMIKGHDLMLPWGQHFGIFKKSMYRSLEAQRRLRYDAPTLALIRTYPKWLNIGKAPCESMADGGLPEIVLEKRHSTKGNVMVEAFFDWIGNRDFKCIVEVDSEAPLNEEKFVGLIKSLNTLDIVGASKRGSLWINEIKQVEMTQEEIEKLLRDDQSLPEIN